MEARDLIMIGSVIVVIIGWFWNSHLNRKHEIYKKKLDHRLETLQSFLPVYTSISSYSEPFKHDKDLTDKISNSRTMFQMYGEQDEWNLFKDFTKALDKRNVEQVNVSINKLIYLIRTRIRNQLDLPKVDL